MSNMLSLSLVLFWFTNGILQNAPRYLTPNTMHAYFYLVHTTARESVARFSISHLSLVHATHVWKEPVHHEYTTTRLLQCTWQCSSLLASYAAQTTRQTFSAPRRTLNNNTMTSACANCARNWNGSSGLSGRCCPHAIYFQLCWRAQNQISRKNLFPEQESIIRTNSDYEIWPRWTG